MPNTRVVYYAEGGESPVYDWLCGLQTQDRIAYATGVFKLEQLREKGFELRRPVADYVRDGLYELRWKHGHVQYRILYFFHGRNAAVLSHGATKEKALAEADIKKALSRKKSFEANPNNHFVERELPHA